jgi:glutathione peroxidase
MGKVKMFKTAIGILIMSFSITSFAACPDLYNHQFTTLQGAKINLCDYQDKPILVVNTASKCGFTPQFETLEALYKRYQSKGLLVIGFPSNDFKQELSSDKEIGDFCINTYSVKFPMITKTSVTGPNANPLHKQLIALTKQAPMWNFYKYVILPGGKQVYAYSSDVDPSSDEIMSKLKPFLK